MSEQEKLFVTAGSEGVVDTAATNLLMDLIGAGHSQTDHRVVSDHLRQYARHLAALPDQRDERGGEALREAWRRLSNALDDIPGGMHAKLEDAASALDAALSTPATPEPTEAGEWPVPDGWVLVPVELTKVMVDAWCEARPDFSTKGLSNEAANRACAEADWSALLAARPPVLGGGK